MKELNMLVNHLSYLPKTQRSKYLTSLGHLGTKLIFDKITKLTDVLNLYGVEDFQTRVKLRNEYIKKHPERHWDYAEYLSRDGLITFNGDVLVSTEGHILKAYKTGRVGLLCHDALYVDNYHRFEYGGLSLRTHRCVASTFLPIPKRLAGMQSCDLDISFRNKTLKKALTHLTNVEWLYGNEKQRKGAKHATYSENEYFLFTVVDECDFKGAEFVLNQLEIKRLGLEPKELRRDPNWCFNRTLGMCIKPVTSPKGYAPMPLKLKSLIAKNEKYFNARLKPIIGTVLEGEYAGLTFSLFGEAEIVSAFSSNKLYHLTKRSRKEYTLYGCTFKASGNIKAIALHQNLTLEIALKLRLLGS